MEIAGVCLPMRSGITTRDLVTSTEQLVERMEDQVDRKMDPMGDMSAAMVIIASMRGKYPCPAAI